MSRIRFASLLLALPLLIATTRGQSSAPLGVYVSTLPTGSGWTETQKEVHDLARQQLESLGATLTEKEDGYVLYLDATENDGIVSVSFLIGHTLPEEVLELGKNAEGKWVEVEELFAKYLKRK